MTFKIAMKKCKILGKKSNKNCEEPVWRNCKTLWKDIKKRQTVKFIMYVNKKIQYHKDFSSSKCDL